MDPSPTPPFPDPSTPTHLPTRHLPPLPLPLPLAHSTPSQTRAPTSIYPPTSSRTRLVRVLLLYLRRRSRRERRMFLGKMRGKGRGGLGVRRKGSGCVVVAL